MSKSKLEAKKQKKMKNYLLILSIIILLLILMANYYENASLRSCIREVENNEANLSREKANEICQKISELNSI